MPSRLAPAAIGILALASAAGEASATVTVYLDQTGYNAAISNSTIFNFGDVTQPGTVSQGGVTFGNLSLTGSADDFPIVVGSGSAVYGGSAFFTSLSLAPGIDASDVLCTSAGSMAIGFLYGDFADGGGLPFTVTLSTGESFQLSTPPNPGFDTGFVGFVSNTPITSVTFSDDGQGFDLLQVDNSPAGAVGAPEPGPFALLATGLLYLAVLPRRRRIRIELRR
jgi:hypothetical protein